MFSTAHRSPSETLAPPRSQVSQRLIPAGSIPRRASVYVCGRANPSDLLLETRVRHLAPKRLNRLRPSASIAVRASLRTASYRNERDALVEMSGGDHCYESPLHVRGMGRGIALCRIDERHPPKWRVSAHPQRFNFALMRGPLCRGEPSPTASMKRTPLSVSPEAFNAPHPRY